MKKNNLKTIQVHPKWLLAARSKQRVCGLAAGHAPSATSSLWPRLRVGGQGAMRPLCPLAACLWGRAVAVPGNTAHPGTALPAARRGFAAAFARRIICSGAGVGFGTQRRDHTYYLNTTAKGLEGGKKKKEKGKKENEYEIFVAVWRYTHTCTHNTNTAARLRVAGSRGRKTPAKIVFKTTLAAEPAEGKPFGPKLAPAACQAGACSRPGWGSRGSPAGTARTGEMCQPFPGGCPHAGLRKDGERVPGMEIPMEAALVRTGGFSLRQHSGIAGPILEMPIRMAALAVGLGWPGTYSGNDATWRWYGINGHRAAKDGLRVEMRRTGIPQEQVTAVTPLTLGLGGHLGWAW